MEQRHTSHLDVQVVGGGLAGLIVAALAIEAGCSVRVIERHSAAGGRARSTEREGFVLNQGPHALYRQGDLFRVLSSLGVPPRGVHPNPAGSTGTIDGRVGRLPIGLTSLITTPLLSVGSKSRLASLMRSGLNGRPEALRSVTVDTWLDDLSGGRADLRALLWGLTNLVTYNSVSDIASADGALANLQMALGEGVMYVEGGWATIVASLRARLPGGALVTNHIVEVTSDQAGTTCRSSDGTEYRAAATVLTAGLPAVADQLLGTGDRFQSAAGPPVEASVLDLGLRRPPRAGSHLGLDRGLYASVHSVPAGIAPDGLTLLSLARYRRHDEELSADETRDLLLELARENGVAQGDITMMRYLHRMTVTGGMPLAARGGLAGRPTVVVPGHDAVFLAGDWVGPRGLLSDASAASAADAAARAIAASRRAPAAMTT